jgi:5-methylcytosine-specific restriction endonuclease McrA
MENNCNKHNLEIVKKLKSNNTYFLVKQCMTCGEANNSSVKFSLVPNHEILKWFSVELNEKYYENKRSIYLIEKQTEKEEWLKNYSIYLNSQQWKNKRIKVLERDRYLCQACLNNRANEVHHLTYKHVFNEPLFELISICKPCHDKLTKLDNQ